MPKDVTLVDNFVTVTKRLPLKARCLVAVSLIVVIYELVSGITQLNREPNNIHKITSNEKESVDVGKVRERKDVKLDDLKHTDILQTTKDVALMFLNEGKAAKKRSEDSLKGNDGNFEIGDDKINTTTDRKVNVTHILPRVSMN